MSKFSVDFKALEDQIFKKAYKLSEVKDQIEVVAFDVVRFKDADKGANLWQVQSADDGEYIVRLYEEEDQVKTASKNPWEVLLNKEASHLHIFYKGEPLVKMASSQLGIPASEVSKVPGYLPSKLASNKKLVNALLLQLSETTKKEILNKYPELA